MGRNNSSGDETTQRMAYEAMALPVVVSVGVLFLIVVSARLEPQRRLRILVNCSTAERYRPPVLLFTLPGLEQELTCTRVNAQRIGIPDCSQGYSRARLG